MGHSSCQSLESQSSRIPSIFNGSDFSNWKSEMESFLKSINFKCWDVVINGYDKEDKCFNNHATHILYSHIDDVQYGLISHCLTAQEIWNTLNTRYGKIDKNSSKPKKINSDSDLCSEEETDENSSRSDDGDSIDNEIESFSYEELVYMCTDLTKIVDKLHRKNKSLKSKNHELNSKINCLESEFTNVMKLENSDCEGCLKLKTDLVHLNKNIQRLKEEILILKDNEVELKDSNNSLQKEFNNFKAIKSSKHEIAEKESLLKTESIL